MPLEDKALLPLLRMRLTMDGLAITEHARQRQAERSISVADIINCIQIGQILEEQAHGRDPKVLIRGEKLDGQIIHIWWL
ncbi:MAG: DUF4258 domain-containing protein [Firmicutes bacterium]|nr:DUF4258 domain-containing protein [Bacillota bacterium]